MKKQFIVIGMGRFGRSVAMTLSKLDHEVLAIDSNEGLVQEISEHVTHAVQLDALNEKALMEIGVTNFDVAIVAIGADIQANIFAVITLKQLGVKYIIAKAQNEKHANILSKIGVDKVVSPEHDMGMRLAYNLTSTDIVDFIELSPEINVIEIQAPAVWHNHTLIDLDLRSKYEVSILAIKSDSGAININPAGQEVIKPKDIIIVIGEKVKLNKMINKFK